MLEMPKRATRRMTERCSRLRVPGSVSRNRAVKLRFDDGLAGVPERTGIARSARRLNNSLSMRMPATTMTMPPQKINALMAIATVDSKPEFKRSEDIANPPVPLTRQLLFAPFGALSGTQA